MSIEPTSARDAPADAGLVGLAVLRELPGTAVFVFDRDLRVLLATGAAVAEHAWFCDAMEGRTLADAVPAASYPHLQAHFRRALDGEACAFDYQAPDDPRWFRVEVGALRQDDGPIVGGVVVSRDITAERHTEEALRASRGYLQDVLDCLNVPVSVKDADYRLVSLNREYSRLQQRDRADLVGKTVFDLFPDQFAQAFDADDRNALRTGASVTTEREVPSPTDRCGPTSWCARRCAIRPDASTAWWPSGPTSPRSGARPRRSTRPTAVRAELSERPDRQCHLLAGRTLHQGQPRALPADRLHRGRPARTHGPGPHPPGRSRRRPGARPAAARRGHRQL